MQVTKEAVALSSTTEPKTNLVPTGWVDQVPYN